MHRAVAMIDRLDLGPFYADLGRWRVKISSARIDVWFSFSVILDFILADVDYKFCRRRYWNAFTCDMHTANLVPKFEKEFKLGFGGGSMMKSEEYTLKFLLIVLGLDIKKVSSLNKQCFFRFIQIITGRKKKTASIVLRNHSVGISGAFADQN